MFKILLSILFVGLVAAQNPTTKAPSSLTNVTVPKNNDTYTCLKLQFDLTMSIKYLAQFEGKAFNATTDIKFPAAFDYDGTCAKAVDTVTLTFFDGWSLYIEYSLDSSDKYKLSGLILNYSITEERFPNATQIGKQFTANASNISLFPGSKKNAYKCNAQTSVDLVPSVTLQLSNYLGEPFYEKKNGDFDTAIDCPADATGTNKLVPIIVGIALAVLVVLVLIAYLIGRRRHRSGYQSV